jgi:hypothetical protein
VSRTRSIVELITPHRTINYHETRKGGQGPIWAVALLMMMTPCVHFLTCLLASGNAHETAVVHSSTVIVLRGPAWWRLYINYTIKSQAPPTESECPFCTNIPWLSTTAPLKHRVYSQHMHFEHIQSRWYFRFLRRQIWKWPVIWDIEPCGLSDSSPWWWRQQSSLKRR